MCVIGSPQQQSWLRTELVLGQPATVGAFEVGLYSRFAAGRCDRLASAGPLELPSPQAHEATYSPL